MKQHGLPEREWQMGKTKIFLRHCVHEPLEDKRTALVHRSAVQIQKIYRGYVRRKGTPRQQNREVFSNRTGYVPCHII